MGLFLLSIMAKIESTLLSLKVTMALRVLSLAVTAGATILCHMATNAVLYLTDVNDGI
ncbi:hypothetical protein K0M31_001264 [Melipona bicolor]|uniref:Uncharacterized protein n=1 Tax=Melipona bicolor TaxID=60889 RepID=A0AA40GFB7_9HYME|nr:hypothetical protein K0M31_001264 [Melipona bicolor]